jgi:hypothetical protein
VLLLAPTETAPLSFTASCRHKFGGTGLPIQLHTQYKHGDSDHALYAHL